MSKGSSPRSTKKKPTVMTRDTSEVITTASTRGKATKSSQNCWKFPLDGITSAGLKATKGTQVYGVPNGSRILVIASMGTLGYVPEALSKRLQAIVERNGASLAGEVLSDSKAGSVVMVQLCIS
jgi:hypothetical protein